MGGGGLRILGKKTWHVWRRDNIERVLRDEREHAEAQRKREDDRRHGEQESRAEALRVQSGLETQRREHINFFAKEEEAHTLALLGGGKGARTSKSAATETLGKHGDKPWYAKAEASLEPSARDTRRERKRKRELEADDPLRQMRPPREEDEERESIHGRRHEDSERKHKKHNKEKKHKKHKREKKDWMAELRREREEREAVERERSRRLLN
ncbi:hypothetical protein Poli38472_009831 [Pythium oligandrum]|uniref:CBF1-interacting co-repressor CIR N-terminal domain-containing protein n=1 Tax=Pythium oligandrum TaxID=41045 RepID=A0A8K1FL52_PYTOL|nr:hypothetical protein Poli38472_009831 [Pythium oligandrum]|eukprot:TMW62338.1 hypothetical protein Poli38472_009831 [Pythium oligandrum]